MSTPTFDWDNVTTDVNNQPTKTPQPKVIAAAIGAGVGGAVTTLGVYIFETLSGVDLPTAVEGSLLTLVVAGLSFLSGYIKKPSAKAG